MSPDALPIVNAIIGGVNLLALLAVATQAGRWMGRVDIRLDHLERHQQKGAT